MKTKIFAPAVVALICAAHGGAATANPGGHIYANTVTGHNTASIQYAIINNVINAFTNASFVPSNDTLTFRHDNKGTKNMYGRAPMYGPTSEYGEYGDDGTVFLTGRNGGDSDWPIVGNVWVAWQHFAEDVKFDHYDKLDTDYDLLMVGATGDRVRVGDGMSEWGVFAGFVGGDQENAFMDIDEKGGYFGIYNGYTNNNLRISMAADAGVISNDVDTTYGTDEYTNIWVGVGINASYKIALDDTFALLPNVYGGYTWVKSGNYTSESGDKIRNNNFNMFNVAPGLRAVKHIANGWFGTASGAYVMTFVDGGDVKTNGVSIIDLDTSDYWEYGIALEKSIERLAIRGNINRHDGGRTGWNFGLNIKYNF